MEITYSDTRTFSADALESLFLSIEWESGRFPERLKQAMEASHSVVSAWDGDTLVGLMNCLSDGHMTAYFHYLLVRKGYQGLGIGRAMVSMMLERYADIPAKVLISVKEALGFYEACGFTLNTGALPVYVKSEELLANAVV